MKKKAIEIRKALEISEVAVAETEVFDAMEMNDAMEANNTNAKLENTKVEQGLSALLEAVLMAANKPLSKDEVLALFDEHERPSKEVLTNALTALQETTKGDDRGIKLVEIASGFQFQVKTEWAPWVTKLWEEKAPRYSRALLETLALIAYRQPITRGDIEDIRGVSISQSIFKTLLEEREWIRVVGHREVPGRPALYATTKAFLDYFGLKTLEELPSLPDIMNLDEVANSLEAHADGKVEQMLQRNARILEQNVDGEFLQEEEEEEEELEIVESERSQEIAMEEFAAQELEAQELAVQELDPQELNTQEFDIQELDTQELDIQQLDAQELEIEELELQELKATESSEKLEKQENTKKLETMVISNKTTQKVLEVELDEY